jgi:hypothetical protein
MAFSHTVGGTTFTEASFQGNAYADEQIGFPKALEKMVEHVANAYHGASTDPLTVGAGARVLTVANDSGQIPAFAVGMPVRIARTSDPAGVWMQGEITTWDGVTGIATINVDATKGSGSYSDWSIVIGGHLTTASGTPPLAVSQGGTGASGGNAALANLTPGFAGIVETNGNFVDAVIFGPALDPVDWSPRTAAPTSSLMLATVEALGADAEVKIWDLTDDLAGAIPLANIVVAGAATPTSIAAAMGYIVVGSEDGITIIDPHDGSWTERTQGYPRSLTSTSSPAITTNDVVAVAVGFSDAPSFDPRTGGPMPSFVVGCGATNACDLYKDDGSCYSRSGGGGGVGNAGVAIVDGHVVYCQNVTGDAVFASQDMISAISANDWAQLAVTRSDGSGYGFGCETNMSWKGGFGAYSHQNGLVWSYLGDAVASDQFYSLHCNINRTYNTGWMTHLNRGVWLANSKTADRNTDKANTLTESGTITEAAVETGAEQKAYSEFVNGTDYLQRGNDADYNAIGTGTAHIAIWFKATSNPANQCFMAIGNSGSTIRFLIRMDSVGTLTFLDDGASANVSIITPATYVDGEWHRADFVRVSSTERYAYIDGALVGSSTTDAGSLTATMTLNIGVNEVQGDACTAVSLSLARYGVIAPSAAQIRQMHDAERGMFAANAKCLLQGATDAVLYVDTDPISGKVIATQADSQVIWNGLVAETVRSIAMGGTSFEHGFQHAGDIVEINDANLYVDIAAKNLRQEVELLRAPIQTPAVVEEAPVFASIAMDTTTGSSQYLVGNSIADSHDGWDEATDRYNFPEDGKYFIYLSLHVTPVGAWLSGEYGCELHKNGAFFQMRNSGHSPSDNTEAGANVSVGAIMSFLTTDYVQMYFTTNSGNNRAASPRNYMNIMKVGD